MKGQTDHRLTRRMILGIVIAAVVLALFVVAQEEAMGLTRKITSNLEALLPVFY